MLDAALDRARRTFDRSIIENPDGSVSDQLAYPPVAFREIIANALIRRDRDDWSQAFAVEVRLRRDRLVVTRPGGLYGALGPGPRTVAELEATLGLSGPDIRQALFRFRESTGARRV